MSSYFVVMIERNRGREAIVDPEITRREVISRIQSGEYPRDRISFIDFIDGNYKETITAEILAEAELPEIPMSAADLQAAAFDNSRDHRKHGVVS